MLEQNRSTAALIGLGVGAAAVTAGAFYLVRRRAHRADPREPAIDDVGAIAEGQLEAELEGIAAPVSVEAELERLESYETAEGLGESWVEDLEVKSAEIGPEPGHELPIADASRLEPAHHAHGSKTGL